MAIATVIAVPLGLAIGASRVGALLSRPVVDFLRPIPSVALIPILILLYGTQPAVKVTLAAFGRRSRCCTRPCTAWPTSIPWPRTPAGPSACRRAPAADRAAELRAYLATGLRISASVALILVVTGEYIVGVPGIGREVFITQSSGAYDKAYAWILVAGLLGLAVNFFHAVERRVLFWHPSQRADEAGRRTRSWPGRLALQLVLPAALIALWWWTSESSTSIYYPLSRVLDSLQEDWIFEQVGTDLVPSLGRFTAGYAIAAASGIVAGTLIGLAPRVRQASQPVTEFVRSIPPPSCCPSPSPCGASATPTKIAVIALGSVWPVLLNTIDGVRGVDRETLDMARSFGLGGRMRITHVILPAASPKIAVGMRTALSVALILMVISEMVGSTNGLGFQVLSAQRSFDVPGTYAGVIVIGVVGLVVNLGFLVAEGWIMRWHRGARGLLDETTTGGSAARRPRSPPSGARTCPWWARRRSCDDHPGDRPRGQDLRRGRRGLHRHRRGHAHHPTGRDAVHRGAVGMRQDHPAAVRVGPDAADLEAVRLDERAVTAPPRTMALVFQDYSRSLLPWMSIHDNVVLPLKAGRMARHSARPWPARRSPRSASKATGASTPGSSPGACSSGRRSPGRSPTSPRSCCSTSRSPRSTPRPAPTSRTCCWCGAARA